MKETAVYLKVRLDVAHADHLAQDEVEQIVASECDYTFKLHPVGTDEDVVLNNMEIVDIVDKDA